MPPLIDCKKRRFTPCTKRPQWITAARSMRCPNCRARVDPGTPICWDADLGEPIRCEGCHSRPAIRLTSEQGYLDPFVLRRYWTSECTAIVKDLRSRFAGRLGPWAQQVRSVVTAAEAAFRDALGDDTVADLVFEYNCAEAYHSYLLDRGFGFLFGSSAVHFWHRTVAVERPPGFPRDAPLVRSEIFYTPDLGYAGGPNTKAPGEERAENCQHVKLAEVSEQNVSAGSANLGGSALPRWIYERFAFNEDVARLDPARLCFLHSKPPRCIDCGAAILCSCVRHFFLEHFGRVHAVLWHPMKPPRDGTTSVGFREQVCGSCRAKAGLGSCACDTLDFRTYEAAMMAAHCLRERNPHLYAQIFAPDDELAFAPDQGLRANAYVKILGGASVRSLRGEYEQTQDERATFRDLWSSYFNYARNASRKACGLPMLGDGWVREMQLLNLVRSILPGEEVIHNCFPQWLHRLQLDVYVPARRLALEHMGEQHYRPLEYFGGQDALESIRRRDQRKRAICKERGVLLVDVRYDEPLTRENIERLIREAGANGGRVGAAEPEADIPRSSRPVL